MPNRTILAAASLPLSSDQWDRLERTVSPDTLVRVDLSDEAALGPVLSEAEVAILSGDLDERFLAAPRLQWIHCDHAGLTRSARPEVFERDLIVTGSAGRSSAALAEHAMMFALMLSSGYPMYYDAQQRHEWLRIPEMQDLRALSGRTMGILGMGHTGKELARRAKAFDMRVVGYRRRVQEVPSHVDQMFSADNGDTIDPILEQADVLVLALGLSNATHRMIGAAQIARMKRTAILVNMARGPVIDQAALVSAMREGRLAGAGLDVTDPEPLPAGHELWDVPNVLITPHFTAALPDKSERSLATICENLRRFRSGEPLLNRITPEDVWTGDIEASPNQRRSEP